MAERPAVAKLLRDLRDERGESLRNAARNIEVTPSHLSRVESGEKSPSTELQDRASDYYGVPRELMHLAAGDLPEDVVEILRKHPEAIDDLRHRYG